MSQVQKIKAGDWEQLWDAHYQVPYFYNVRTGVSQWERPAPFPDLSHVGTVPAWVDPNPVTKFLKETMESVQTRLMQRAARVQIEISEIKKYYIQGTEDYNIWYDRFMGDHSRNSGRELAETKCVMSTDCGHTQADVHDPQGLKNVFCYHFAKGRCSKGPECTFFHRIPTENDATRFASSTDVFGRDRHKEHRQDMGGTGSFDQDCATLYVGGISISEATEENMWRLFSEWGTPKKVNIIARLHIAFVTYNTRQNAEFAKVAMAGQSLNGREILNLRWAYDDPNPKVVDEILDDRRCAVLQSAERRGYLGADDSCSMDAYDTKQYYTNDAVSNIGPSTELVLQQRKQNETIAASCNLLNSAFAKMEESFGNNTTTTPPPQLQQHHHYNNTNATTTTLPPPATTHKTTTKTTTTMITTTPPPPPPPAATAHKTTTPTLPKTAPTTTQTATINKTPTPNKTTETTATPPTTTTATAAATVAATSPTPSSIPTPSKPTSTASSISMTTTKKRKMDDEHEQKQQKH